MCQVTESPAARPADASRRGFLAQGASFAAAAVAGAALLPRPLAAEELTSAEWDAVYREPSTPAEALKMLEEGNHRFIAGRPIAPHRDMARLKAIAPKQTPFAAFLGCADSRVPIEIVFDQGFGDVFVSRIAGNIAVAEQIASLEFGTAVLGAKVLYVLGHSACGAVSATMSGAEVPGQISALYFHIRPATRGANGNLDAAIAANVREQALRLRDGSTVIARLVKEGKLLVAGGVYDLNTGAVTPVPLDAA